MREELFRLCSRDIITPRSVRKAIFSHSLRESAIERKQFYWHTNHDDVTLWRCIPAGFACLDVPRLSANIGWTNHGSVAVIISKLLAYRISPAPFSPATFELVAFTVGSCDATVAVPPGSAALTDAFFTELSAYLEVFALYKCQILVAGDFNSRFERPDDANATKLRDLLISFDHIQQVPLIPSQHLKLMQLWI